MEFQPIFIKQKLDVFDLPTWKLVREDLETSNTMFVCLILQKLVIRGKLSESRADVLENRIDTATKHNTVLEWYCDEVGLKMTDEVMVHGRDYRKLWIDDIISKLEAEVVAKARKLG